MLVFLSAVTWLHNLRVCSIKVGPVMLVRGWGQVSWTTVVDYITEWKITEQLIKWHVSAAESGDALSHWGRFMESLQTGSEWDGGGRLDGGLGGGGGPCCWLRTWLNLASRPRVLHSLLSSVFSINAEEIMSNRDFKCAGKPAFCFWPQIKHVAGEYNSENKLESFIYSASMTWFSSSNMIYSSFINLKIWGIRSSVQVRLLGPPCCDCSDRLFIFTRLMKGLMLH